MPTITDDLEPERDEFGDPLPSASGDNAWVLIPGDRDRAAMSQIVRDDDREFISWKPCCQERAAERDGNECDSFALPEL